MQITSRQFDNVAVDYFIVFDPCVPNPCLSGGTCTVVNDTIAQCECMFGLTGDTCEQETGY